MQHVSIELAEKMLIRFDGNKQRLNEFIDNCDKAMSLISKANEPVLFAIIETRITDNARALIRNRSFKSWSELKGHLIDIFSERRTMGQWQLELNSLRQNYNETVLSYSNKVENCYIKLLNSLDESLEDEARKACSQLLKNQALSVFICGLHKDISLIVKAQKPKDLETAIAIALSEEQETKSKNEIQKFQNLSSNKFQNLNKFCSICNKNNHNTNNCRFKSNSNTFQKPPNIRYMNNSNQNNNQNQKFQSHNLNNFTKICNYCKKKGHIISECRKREYNEKIRNQTQQNQNPKSPSSQPSINSLNFLKASEAAFPKSTIQFQAKSQ